MIRRRAAVLGVCLIAGACSPSEAEEAPPPPPPLPPTPVDIVAELVERFDVESCEAANPVGSLKKSGPEGLEMIRAYSAKGDCLDALQANLPELGFAAKGVDGFIIGEGEAKTELVTIERAEGSVDGGIQWEIVER